MSLQSRSLGRRILVLILWIVPVFHPLLLPLLGVASHLLWWTHVLPVAMLSYRHGRWGMFLSVPGSVAFLVAGERIFGAGYGIPADWATVLSLAGALTFTHFLVGGFALYARGLARRYQLLFRNASLGILRVDSGSRVLAANPALLRLLEDDEAGVVGHRIQEINGLGRLPLPAAISKSGGWAGSLEVGGPDGFRTVHVVAGAVPQKEPAGYQVLVLDRTFEAAQQEEIERQVRLATLGESLAGVAHELNNPLTIVLTNAELAEADLPSGAPEDLRMTLRTIREQGERMRGLVRELLGYARPKPSEAPTVLHEFLRRLLHVEAMTHGRQVRWVERLDWEGEILVPADRVQQVVVNLLKNAADAVMEQEGGTVQLHCRREDDAVLVEVIDDGPGIPEESLDRIFQPFVTSKPEGKGTGLGLPISRRLAEELGGALTVRNLPHGGAAFTLRLPLSVPEPVAQSGMSASKRPIPTHTRSSSVKPAVQGRREPSTPAMDWRGEEPFRHTHPGVADLWQRSRSLSSPEPNSIPTSPAS
ncbi:MAG: PAS domain-containing sensor histidine kinase [Gemmatimonadota bacterium]